MINSSRFEVVETLGNQHKRKFALVQKCRDRLTGNWVVTKTVDKSNQSQMVQEQLRKEATFQFDLPGLPTVIAFEETDSILTLVLSWQEGVSLDDFLRTSKNKGADLTPILEKLVTLLNYIHQHNVVHLDLKPSNILVNRLKNDEIQVALIDFGLALHTPVNESRKLVFPLGFAAPEQVLNELSVIDYRTDYYALGIVIWFCFAGKLPFSHPNPSIATNLQITYPLPSLGKRYKQLDKLLGQLAFKYQFQLPPNRMDRAKRIACLNEGKNMRYTSLNTFLNDWKTIKFQPRKWWQF